jgi:hypothetical protein
MMETCGTIYLRAVLAHVMVVVAASAQGRARAETKLIHKDHHIGNRKVEDAERLRCIHGLVRGELLPQIRFEPPLPCDGRVGYLGASVSSTAPQPRRPSLVPSSWHGCWGGGGRSRVSIGASLICGCILRETRGGTA